jgi:hypothetical protein
MSRVPSFAATAAMAKLDFGSRAALRRWRDLAARGRQLADDPALLSGFQPEPVAPADVGMGELLSDQFSPEELVAMWSGPHYVDWDAVQQVPAA